MLLQKSAYPEAKIQYFAGIMINFLPTIFYGKWKNRFNTHMDFSEFYLSEFDMAYSKYHNERQVSEKEYPFRFILLDSDTLENEIQDYLTRLDSLFPAKNNREKAKIIICQACRLFELYHNMADLFFDKIFKKGRSHL